MPTNLRPTAPPYPSIGISQCLQGDAVRYDGTGKYHALTAKYIQPLVYTQAFCPEAAAGLGVPREPVRLQESPQGERAVGVAAYGDTAQLDVTIEINEASTNFVENVESKTLCGFILKARSPSCGLGSTPIYRSDYDSEPKLGNGLFTRHVSRHLPYIALAEEGDLECTEDCWRFLSACYLVWRNVFQQKLEPSLNELLTADLSVTDLWSGQSKLVETANKKAVPWERLFTYWNEKLL